MKEKCHFPDGIIIKPDGENELDPCTYETVKVLTNCIIEICRCKRCGNESVSWRRTNETQELTEEDWDLIL